MSKGQRLAWWLSLPAFLALLVVAWNLGRKEPAEPWPVLCLHADGKLTLGSFEGRSLSKQELTALGRQMLIDSHSACLVMKPAPGLPIEAWFDTINGAAEGGIGYYEFQSGAKKLAFHVDAWGTTRGNTAPEIIDLRQGEERGEVRDLSWARTSTNGYDKHVIVSQSMSFEDLHDAIANELRPGVSMLIDGPRFLFIRDRDEDRRHLPPKKPAPWERIKEKVEGWVK